MVGIIPAAGGASRISPIPCSKEIFPVGSGDESGAPSIKVAASYLLDSFVKAGVQQAYLIMRKGKWDIPQYLGLGMPPDFTLAYLITEPTAGTHYTIDLAYPFVKDKIVLLGFPDVLFKPKHAYFALLAQQKQTGADVVLGLFKTNNPQKGDLVDVGLQKRVKRIVVKPKQTSLTLAWTIAVWTPAFSRYLHEFVTTEKQEPGLYPKGSECFIGDVMQQAINDGLQIEGVTFEEGKFVDIGTFPELQAVMKRGF